MSNWYWEAYREYEARSTEEVVLGRIFDERTKATPVDAFYFYQDTWAAARVLSERPAWLLDVGSTALLLGILSLVVPVVSVDVRPLPVSLPGLTCRQGDITALPFETGSVPMASSLSVVEHIGLGRYGDALDPQGSEKACKELARVLAPGGHLLLSVPVAEKPLVIFNAHRLLTRAQVREWLGMEENNAITIEGGKMKVWCAEFVK